MKFPRNARIFRGHLDAAPFAMVFFLLVMFVMLGNLVYTPGVRVKLPKADNLPGTPRPMVAVAIATTGQLYFENQETDAKKLRVLLANAAKRSAEPLTLLLEFDEDVSLKMLMNMALLARDAGIFDISLAAMPGPSTRPILRTKK